MWTLLSSAKTLKDHTWMPAACSSKERLTKSLRRKISTPAKAWSASFGLPLSWRANRAAKKVLMSDKSNVMTFAGGLWQRVFKIVAAEYPEIQTQHMYVDALCMHMARDPKQFDVIVTNNMFGDIITDLAAALQGGLGMAASGNIHPGKTSMFEPVHGSAPPFAGKNIANPIGAISTAAMMLEHLGFAKESERINKAVLAAVQQKQTTSDIGGSLGTKEAAEWIALSLSRP